MGATKEYMAAYMRERYRKNAEIVRAYKVEKGCADCGYNAHHAGLEFDHIVPRNISSGSAKGTVASLMGKSIKRIMEEIEKCDVVCGTCHNIRTWERKQEDS
ncbi:HNH endonuclease [Streptomyces phage Braelyn]|uniref:HNH endonuclease n=1 Tax=Streptomyces phage Braelyn TaxID=2593356 RepID=A0A514U225_9CAUD|nr:HNH endonuclease [Streptomyces phage Braelyn]QDK02990.1 HNH endonuclease [Streptomyces phage Braelyn]WNM73016.1 HNH endonuclease [Streptomyces phage Persimmon]